MLKCTNRMCFLKTYFPPLNILQIFRTLYEPILQHIILAAQIAQIHHTAMGIFLRKKRKLCSDACSCALRWRPSWRFCRISCSCRHVTKDDARVALVLWSVTSRHSIFGRATKCSRLLNELHPYDSWANLLHVQNPLLRRARKRKRPIQFPLYGTETRAC